MIAAVAHRRAVASVAPLVLLATLVTGCASARVTGAHQIGTPSAAAPGIVYVADFELDARDVLRLPYAISAILPQNARSRRVAERSGARAAGQMDVVGLTWDRWVWPLAAGHA